MLYGGNVVVGSNPTPSAKPSTVEQVTLLNYREKRPFFYAFESFHALNWKANSTRGSAALLVQGALDPHSTVQ